MGSVIGVIGGSGGVGASSFAAVLAAVAGRSLLIDLDVTGGGIDVTLGVEATAGARWSGLRVAGGHLDADELLTALPHWGPVAVLAADVPTLDADAVLQVIDTARAAVTVVLDLPRASCAERAAALCACDLVVVVARGDVDGLVAAHALTVGLPEVPAGLVLRRGEVAERDVAAVVGHEVLGVLPPLRATSRPLQAARLPRRLVRVAAGVLGGVGVFEGGGTDLAVERRPPSAVALS
ncbi:MAG TPA: hypothetical protein VKB75_08710 [Jatrophihabitans sp.]|nr:hypothetical protein [Jatrophihabitans sp.]